MNNCPKCNSSLMHSCKLIDDTISPMKNKSKIIYPKCSVCNHTLQVPDIKENISASRKVLLISGTAGAGKTAMGQFIESKSDYIFIDGDAISKRVNHYARLDPSTAAPDYQKETIRTMLVLLGLGYDVVVGYVINQEALRWYREELARYQITPVFRVLVPNRNVCIQRDINRECWTAGAEYVDRWYNEQRAFLKTDPDICIDNSQETLADTFDNHFQDLLSK
jgi:adenylylsulfate kinase-like enzyme